MTAHLSCRLLVLTLALLATASASAAVTLPSNTLLAFDERTPATDTRTAGVIVPHERQPLAEAVSGVRMGWSYNRRQRVNNSLNINLGYDGKFEFGQAFWELGAGLSLPASDSGPATGGLYSELGASYYLLDSNTSPYAGGGVMLRFVGPSGENAAAYAQLGLMFNRDSPTRFYLDGRITQNIVAMTFGPGDSTPAVRTYPTEFAASLGVGW